MLCISRQLFNMPSKNKKKKWALLVSYSHLLSTAQSGLAHVMEASYCLKPLTESRWSMQCGPHWWDWCDQQWEPVTQPQTGHREALLQPKVYDSTLGPKPCAGSYQRIWGWSFFGVGVQVLTCTSLERLICWFVPIRPRPMHAESEGEE